VKQRVSDLPALHLAAREIFDEALSQVDAGESVRRAVQLEGSRLKIVNTTLDLANNRAGIYAIAIGKAARPMASALSEILCERLTAGVIAAPPTTLPETSAGEAQHAVAAATLCDVSFPDCWRVFEGGHPLPNLESLNAAQVAFELLRRADDERAVVIFLISGGGSALMEWPRSAETTLEDLRQTNEALVSCGARIEEINAVRRAISEVKGGGLSRRAPHSPQVSLIISDTGAGREAIVASGPTFNPPTDAPAPDTVIKRYNLEERLPAAIQRALRQPLENVRQTAEHPLRKHYVLLDNEHALVAAAAAARSRGFTVEIARDVTEQPIEEGCAVLLSRLFALSSRTSGSRRGVCLISGGEFKCPVRGGGVGGRNAEAALRWAIELDRQAAGKDWNSHVVALCAGTDGIDGNSPAAGAKSDETTVRRALELNLDAHRLLDDSDAYTFFRMLNEAIITGPTGTNVRDLRILLAS
jgi:glycerate 2-kinase